MGKPSKSYLRNLAEKAVVEVGNWRHGGDDNLTQHQTWTPQGPNAKYEVTVSKNTVYGGLGKYYAANYYFIGDITGNGWYRYIMLFYNPPGASMPEHRTFVAETKEKLRRKVLENIPNMPVYDQRIMETLGRAKKVGRGLWDSIPPEWRRER